MQNKFQIVQFQILYTKRRKTIKMAEVIPEWYPFELASKTFLEEDLELPTEFRYCLKIRPKGLPDALKLNSHFVVSTKLRQLLVDFKVNCQIASVPIVGPDYRNEKYSLVRFKTRLDALDQMQSNHKVHSVKKWAGADMGILHLFFREDFESTEHAFIIAGNGRLAFSKQLIRAIEESKITGVVPFDDDGSEPSLDALSYFVDA